MSTTTSSPLSFAKSHPLRLSQQPSARQALSVAATALWEPCQPIRPQRRCIILPQRAGRAPAIWGARMTFVDGRADGESQQGLAPWSRRLHMRRHLPHSLLSEALPVLQRQIDPESALVLALGFLRQSNRAGGLPALSLLRLFSRYVISLR